MGREVKYSAGYLSTTTRLNPPRGIFCWEAEFANANHPLISSQSPTGDFLLGRSPHRATKPATFLSQSPTGDFLLGRTSVAVFFVNSLSQSPTGDFLLGSGSFQNSLGSSPWRVSIPHGGFFVGKLKENVMIKQNASPGLNPPRGIFCWEDPCEEVERRSRSSQSPTGDFLLGRFAGAVFKMGGNNVSIPHGGFFVGKVWE